MNTYKQWLRGLIVLLLLTCLSAAPAAAQTQQNIEDLKKQLEDLKSRGANFDSWSPTLKGAYNKSLAALNAAYEKALAVEIQQLNELLKVVTEPAARQPLEEQLRVLKSAGQAPANAETPAALTAAPADTNARAAATPAPATPAAKPIPEGKFMLIVHTRVKGTGYPVDNAHIQLLKLKPDTDKPEYEPMESGFKCKDEKNRCLTKRGDGLATLVIMIDVTEPPQTLKIAGLDAPYFPTLLDENIVPTSTGKKIVYLDMIPKDAENYRAIVGVEQSGANGAESQQNIFLDLFFSRPLIARRYLTEPGSGKNSLCSETSDQNAKKAAKDKGYACDPPRQRIWGDFRVTSVPQPRQNLFQALNGSFSGALNGALGKVKDLETGFSFLAGYQLRLTKGSLAASRFDFSVIVGGGAVGALAPERTVTIFNKPTDTQRLRQVKEKLERELNKEDAARYNAEIDGDKYKFLAFAPQGRDRFFRNYFGGFRFETHFGDTTPTRPSGMFDLTIGQDEAVTHGKFQGPVLRLDGFFPLPLGRDNLVYLFGTAQMALKKAKSHDPLLLPVADTTQTLSSPETLVIPVPAANRDLYRFGVGVNLFQLFSSNGPKE
jgi:hypothetical protein